MKKDWSDFIRTKVKGYDTSEIIFTKKKQLDWLANRNKCSLDEMKKEIFDPKDLVFTEKQVVDFEGHKEERYKCYFVYSSTRGRLYVLSFNGIIKAITVVPLGRATLRRYKKRFK